MIKRLSTLLAAMAIFAIAAAGTIIRLVPQSGTPTTLAEDYLSPYYFDKFQRLTETGQFPAADVWEWAPETHVENAPPGLAYASWLLFRAANIVTPAPDPLAFADLFPILAFVFWCIAALAIFRRSPVGIAIAAVMLALLAFTPAAISLTSYGRYTQETLGVFLVFLTVWTLSRTARGRDAAIAALAAAALILTWQQFPIVYAGAFLIIIANAAQRRWRETRLFGIAALAALFAAELTMRVMVRSGYSPIEMLWEFALGAWMQFAKNPDFLTTMVRSNWQRVGIGEFWQSYGPLTITLAVLGMITALRNLKENKRLAALLFGGGGFLAAFLYRKEMGLAFGLMLVPIVLALEDLVRPHTEMTRASVLDACRRLVVFVRRRRILLAVGGIAASGFAGWLILTRMPQGIAFITKNNPPKPEIEISSNRNADGTIDVTLIMTNRGGTTFFSDELWYGMASGMHIAVGNADILRLHASDETSPPTWRYYSVYPYARQGDSYFIETRFRQLRNGESGRTYLTLRPTANGREPIIFYRGWMPETSCILHYQNAIGETPLETLMLETEGEPCIIRTPDYFTSDAPLCPNKVMAARSGLQDFRCYSIPL